MSLYVTQLAPDVLNDFYKTSFDVTLYMYKDQSLIVEILSTPPLQMFDGFIRYCLFKYGN